MDGPISITECAAHTMEESRCQVKETCRVRGNWNKINMEIRRSLQSLTLADMTAKDLHVPTFTLPAAE
jgi:DNA-binding IscR family transcriptional regulator